MRCTPPHQYEAELYNQVIHRLTLYMCTASLLYTQPSVQPRPAMDSLSMCILPDQYTTQLIKEPITLTTFNNSSQPPSKLEHLQLGSVSGYAVVQKAGSIQLEIS